VRVRTIGRFEIEVGGRVLAADGKPQKRPLELLQALIACGGAASTQRLADLLWPEAEGDRALDAFEVALRRLRQLLGNAESLPLRGGRLMLDEQRVWVDVLHGPVISRPRVDTFLPDQAAPWALAARERLARGAPLAASAGV
jgi:DNA-binding SARP family transcriptional activator